MLKRFSSLILAVVIGGSVFAGTARLRDEHVCKMAGMQMPMVLPSLRPSHGMMPGMEMTPGMHMDHGMEAMPGMEMMAGMETMPDMETMPGMEMAPGMETMPCCKKHHSASAVSEPGSPEPCCVTMPQEPGSSGTAFNLRSPSFSIAVIHPAIVQSALTLPKPSERPYSPQIFLPNLQASYIRNLSILI